MKKENETLYLGQDFKKRNFPKTKKAVDMKFEETPLFKAQAKAEAEAYQPNLFENQVKGGDKKNDSIP